MPRSKCRWTSSSVTALSVMRTGCSTFLAEGGPLCVCERPSNQTPERKVGSHTERRDANIIRSHAKCSPHSLCGTVQATITDGASPAAEIAWVTGIPWQGRGFATEADGALVRWLCSCGIYRISANNPTEALCIRRRGGSRWICLLYTS